MVLTEWAEAKPLIFRGMFPGIISGDVSHPRPHLDCSHNPLCTGCPNVAATLPSLPPSTRSWAAVAGCDVVETVDAQQQA